MELQPSNSLRGGIYKFKAKFIKEVTPCPLVAERKQMSWGKLAGLVVGVCIVVGSIFYFVARAKEPAGMVYVKGGTFQMGSYDGESDVRPVHRVTVSSFWIGKYEVTQAEWASVMGSNPSQSKGANKPVENLSWYDCVKYCNAKSRAEGKEECYQIDGETVTLLSNKGGYRLPTEAEWEYAARGGNKSRDYTYSGSNTLGSVGWYGENSGGVTHEVGTKQPNELGIYDMSGNVFEWCWDWYSSYSSTAQQNPTGETTGSSRMCRSGSCYNYAVYCRSSYRYFTPPSNCFKGLGLRLVFVP